MLQGYIILKVQFQVFILFIQIVIIINHYFTGKLENFTLQREPEDKENIVSSRKKSSCLQFYRLLQWQYAIFF